MRGVNPRQPMIRFMNDRELDDIHLASLEILDRTGLNVHHAEAQRLLARAGARMDGVRARIPAHLVKRALETAPERIVLCRRTGERTMPLEGNKTYFGTGSDLKYTLDHETGERRPSVLADVARAARVSDALDNIDFVMSFGLAGDRPPQVQDVAHFAAMVENTSKPLVLTQFEGQASLGRIHRLAAAIAGGEAALRRSPFFALYGQFVSPLQHDENALARLLFCADKEIAIIYIPTIMAGATGPVTMAGALALGNAEALAGLVIHQLHRPGAPFIYGGCVCPFDMRVAGIAYGAPEWHMASAILAQLARRYRLPVFSTAGCTDSKLVDEQAVMEGTYSLLLAGLSGANLIHDVGYLESGLTGSLVYLTLMDEATAMVRRTLRNFTVDSDSLGVDVVDKVGPGGHFLEEAHTLKHFRDECWYPVLLDRQKFDGWQAQGAPTMQMRALERLHHILHSHRPAPLPEAAKSLICESTGGI